MSTDGTDKLATAAFDIAQDDQPSDEKKDINVTQKARVATEREHQMTLLEGIRLYPKAIGWSMAISLCIAMEAFDLCLLNTFCRSNYHEATSSLLTSTIRRIATISTDIWQRAVRRDLPNPCQVASWAIKWNRMWSNHRSDHKWLGI